MVAAPTVTEFTIYNNKKVRLVTKTKKKGKVDKLDIYYRIKCSREIVTYKYLSKNVFENVTAHSKILVAGKPIHIHKYVFTLI